MKPTTRLLVSTSLIYLGWRLLLVMVTAFGVAFATAPGGFDAHTPLATTMVNEWGEVILGSAIAIPIAYAFFGPQGTVEVAQGGAFNLGFATMPVVLQQLPWSVAFGTRFLTLFPLQGNLVASSEESPD